MSPSAAVPARSPWIVSAPYDALCFIATPLLCAAVVISLAQRVPSQHIWLWVMTISSFGHHLPGFLRAYGDRELFERYRLRLLLAPPAVFALFVFFGLRELDGMLLVLMLWSIWHVMMQSYGFLRIYDAKAGSTDPVSARLDWAISLGGFVTIVLWSSGYAHSLLATAMESGLGVPPAGGFHALRWIVTGVTALVALVYIVHHARRIAQGKPVSRIKLVLLAVTLTFLGGVWIGLGDIILGLAAWELFHDVQYFALTWIYNKRLVQRGALRSRGLSLLFRGGAGLAALYVLLCAAYGSLNYGVARFADGPLQTWLLALVFTSTLLHYYYDSFIWKVRQPRVRDGLGIEAHAAGSSPGAEPAPEAKRAPAAGPRPLYAGIFLVGCASLAVAELRRDPAEDPRPARLALRSAVPGSAEAEANAGLALEASDPAAAEAAYRRALDLDPDLASAHQGLGLLELRRGRPDAAAEAFARAVATDPAPLRSTPSAPTIAAAYVNLGNLRISAGAASEALDLFERALRIDPRSGAAHLGRGRALAALGRSTEAAAAQELALDSGEVRARLDLARKSRAEGDRERALLLTSTAVEAGQADAAMLRLHGLLLAETGQLDGAAEALEQALDSQPGDPEAEVALATVYRMQQRFGDAADRLLPLMNASGAATLQAPESAREGAQLPEHRSLLIECLLLSGRAAEAVPFLRAALAPSDAPRPANYDDFGPRLALAEILASNPDPSVRSGAEAQELALELVERTRGSDPGPLAVLAAAQTELGDLAAARSTFDRAIQAAQAANRPDVVAELERRRALLPVK